MNYSAAAKRSCRNPAHTINSAAETELKRKLSTSELKTLSDKFPLDTVASHVEKVSTSFLVERLTKLILNLLVWVWIPEVLSSALF